MSGMAKRMQIIGVTIDHRRFEPMPDRHLARVQFRYDLGESGGTTDCICQSDLPADASPAAVRNALIQHALGQLRRMPEMWLGETDIALPSNAENLLEWTENENVKQKTDDRDETYPQATDLYIQQRGPSRSAGSQG